jgi:hypothetical protein|nr:MAG TPA: hypothetical protein [Bacteriophage sp.]
MYQYKCIEFRYSNIILKHMQEVTRVKNKDGNIIIYVQKCKKYTKKEWKTRKECEKA